MKRFLLFWILLLFILANCTFGQSIAAHFKNYTTKDGLLSNKVNCVLHAKNGFIWFGTNNGLAKFDGQHFTYYNNQINNSNSISSDIVTALFEDVEENIWIGTYEGGLNKFDLKTKKIKRFKQDDLKNKLPDNRVMAIFKHPFKKNFIVVSLHFFGLIEIDLKTNQITPWKIKLDNGQKNELFGQNIINDIKQIPNLPQYLWITTNRGLLKYNYQTKKGHFIYFKGKKPTSSLDNLNNIFRSIVLESDSVLWISSWGGGILKYDPKSNRWTQYLSDKSLPKSGGKNIIKNIISKSKNEFWIASEDQGFGVFNKISGSFRFFEHQSETDNSIIEGKTCYNIYQDYKKGIWVMMNSGLSYLYPEYQISKRVFIPNPKLTTAGNLIGFTSAVPIQKDSKILIGFEEGDGLYLFDKKYNYIKTIRLPKQGNKSASIFNLVKGQNGKIYFNTVNNEVFVIDENTLEIALVPVNLPNSSAQILTLSYLQNKLFLGFYAEGVAIYDGKKTVFLNQNSGLVTDLRIYTIVEDIKKNIWFGTDRGFSIYSPKSNVFKNFTPKQDISYKVIPTIKVDSQQNVWVVSAQGNIHVFSPKNNYQIVREFRAGFNYPNQFNYQLNFSDSNNLWVSNRAGFLRFNLSNNNFDCYNQTNGLLSILNPQQHTIINKNQLIIPGRGYFDIINTSLLQSENVNSPKLTGVFLIDKNVEIAALSQLDYTQNNLKFQLSSFNFHNPDVIDYYYKLNNDNWQRANNATLNFANLRPDTYSLRFKSVNKLNNQESTVQTLNFRISPPFWLTWWFTLICFLLIAILLWLIYRWRLKQIEKQNLLRIQFEKETGNLKMTALRTQMNPHFLFNSLSAIKLLILKNENHSASQYLTKFSHLLRSILAYSQEETITLSQELALSLNYIEIENLRLGDKMKFEFRNDENINLDEVYVPPLLLQPYLENAIWHGLMPLDKDGILKLEVIKQINFIEINIIDNGIGRKKSHENAQLNPVKIKSFGVDITRKRIELFSNKYTEITEETTDVLNSSNQIDGTHVKLKIYTKN